MLVRPATRLPSSARAPALLLGAVAVAVVLAWPDVARASGDGAGHERAGLEREARLDFDGAFDRYVEAFREAASAKEGEVYLLKLQFLAERTGRYKELAGILDAAIKTKLPPLTDARARSILARARLAAGDVAGAESAVAPLGFISRFAVVGPFDNERGGGFSVAYPPESGPIDLAARYPGKGREVAWLVPERPAFLGRVDLDAMLRPNDEALAYAVTYVKWPGAPTTLALRLGGDEGLKVWWNGDLALARDVNRRFELDQEAVPVAVRTGWNRLLLKVTERKGEWAFAARLTKLDGASLDAPLEVDPRAPTGEPGASAKAEGTPSQGAVDAYAQLEAAGKLGAQDWFRLGYMRFRRAAHDENEHPDREAFQKAVELDPKSAIYQVYLSFVSGQSGEFSVNKEENARRFALERALELDPASARAATLLAEYYLRSMRMPERAQMLVEKALAAAPDAPEAVLLLAEVLERQGMAPIGRARVLGLVTEGRAVRAPAVLRAVSRALRATGDRAGSLRLLEAALTIDRADDGARGRLVEAKRDAGDTAGALSLLQERARLSPDDTSASTERAALLLGLDRLPEAVSAFDEALSTCPTADDVIVARGKALLRMGRKVAAIESFERALTLNPNLVELRKYLELLKDSERPFEADHRLDADEAIAAAAKIPIDPEVASRTLLENTAVKVNPDGTSSTFEQRVVRIENDDGVDQNRSFSAVYAVGEQKATILRATLVRKSGRREEARINTSAGSDRGGEFATYSQAYVELPTAEVGDILVTESRVDDLAQSFFGDYFGMSHYFQGVTPIERSRFTLIAPTARELYFHAKRMDDEPTVSKSADGASVVRVWERRGMPKIEQEPNMPPLQEVAPSIQVSTFKDWNAFARWYWNLVKKQIEVSDEMRAKIKELVLGKATRDEKIRAIYNFVVTDVRYNDKWEFGVHGFKPYNATSIFARRFGDCKDKATLIVTMLGELGIPAYPVLIEGESHRGAEDYSLPLMEHFNHCIAYAPGPGPDGGEGWFLDGTAQHHEATNLPNMDFGATVLIVKPDGGELKTVKWPDPLKENGIQEAHRVALTAEGGAVLGSEIAPNGMYATVVRQAFENPGRRKELLEKIYGRRFAGARVVEESMGDLRNLDAPVRVRFKLEVPRILKQSAGGFAIDEVPSVLFEWLFVDELSGWATKSERKYDVVLPVPSGTEESIEYTIPEGWSVKNTPPEVSLESEFGTYVKRYELRGNVLAVTRKLVVKTQRIPVEKYQAWRAFANEVDRADEERAILGKGGPEQ